MPPDCSVHVRPNRCLNSNYRFIECRHCADCCPRSAVRIVENTPVIEENLCSVCGACTTACQTGAIERQDYCEENLVRMAIRSEGKRVVLFCGRHQEPVRRGSRGELVCLQTDSCLAEISETALFEIGLNNLAELAVDRCRDCPDGANLGQILDHIDRANELLRTVGRKQAVCAREKPGEERGLRRQRAVSTGRPELSRRETLLRLLDGGKQMVLGNIAIDPFSSGAKQNREVCRAEWKDRLVPIYREAWEKAEEHGESARWPSVRMESGCTECGLCARSCAAEALQIVQQEGELIHLYRPMLCVGCRSCEHVCPKQIVSVRLEKTDKPFVARAVFRTKAIRCRSCGKLTIPNETGLCHWCAGKPSADDMKNALRRRIG